MSKFATINYLKNFFRDKNVASITPSSRFTVNQVVKRVEADRPISVIEYGPGDGVITQPLLDHIHKDSQLIVIETNEEFVKQLNQIDDPRLQVYQDTAEKVDEIAREQQAESVDYVISGIPFSFLEPEIRKELLSKTIDLLGEDGRFLAYQTSKHLKPFLEETFREVNLETEIRNIPPMTIYEAYGRK